jgi:hypothetical protein
LERTLAINQRIITLLAVAAVLTTAVVGQLPAAATSTTTSPKSLERDLLPSSYARKQGFTEVLEKANSTSKSGVKSCPNGAQEAFEDPSTQVVMEVQLVACVTNKAAAALVAAAAASGAATTSSPPKQLGSSAVERSGTDSTYGVYWRRGKIVKVVNIETNISSTTTTTTTTTTIPTTTIPTPPITPTQQMLLSNAALEQDKIH